MNRENFFNWQGVVVHHTASADVGVEIIRQWHLDRGWDDIGYHFVIRADGEVEAGRPLSRAGAHARGRNFTHIGIALTGCFSGTPPNANCLTQPTAAQLGSLRSLLSELVTRFGIPLNKIERHHAACPGNRCPLEEIIQQLSLNSA